MKKQLRVLHIASFVGNIGDNANHIGSKLLREKYLDYDFCITEKEIREFYWKQWFFNSEKFIEEANEYDLVMIGGGNYFELWVDNSATGTSIDISNETLKKIEKPFLFYALGCDIGQGASDSNIKKFRQFLDFTLNNPKYLITVRNDGALENIKNFIGEEYAEKIYRVADGGFFTTTSIGIPVEIEENKKNIVINIAGDMLETRFPNKPGKIDYNEFVMEMKDVLQKTIEDHDYNVNIILIPHIFRDLKTIYDLLDSVKDEYRRKYFRVAPYLIGNKGQDYNFAIYKYADLILGMRFHANVCGIAMKRSTIGLINYIQIENLYKDINSSEYVVINEIFKEELVQKIKLHLDQQEEFEDASKNIREKLMSDSGDTYIVINKWLNKLFREE